MKVERKEGKEERGAREEGEEKSGGREAGRKNGERQLPFSTFSVTSQYFPSIGLLKPHRNATR